MLFVSLPLGFKVAGIDGVLVAYVISTYASWPIMFYYQFQQDLLNLKRELLGVLVFIAAGTLGICFLYIMDIMKLSNYSTLLDMII